MSGCHCDECENRGSCTSFGAGYAAAVADVVVKMRTDGHDIQKRYQHGCNVEAYYAFKWADRLERGEAKGAVNE